METIKGLINKEIFKKQVETNGDSYGKACVDVAINVMKHLDSFKGEFNIGYSPDMSTPHGIICKLDNEGLTGWMAGNVASMVANHHKEGWKFWLANSLNQYTIKKENAINESIKAVVSSKLDLASDEEVREYVAKLIERFKPNEKDEVF